MTQLELTKLLHKTALEHNKRIFTLKEISLLTNESPSRAAMTLIRAKRNKIVERVKNLWINAIERPTLEELALLLQSTSYVSFESALYKHNAISQSPRGGLTMATAGRSSKIATFLGNIHYIHIAKQLFWGFDENRAALPEKALLDLIYTRIRRGAPEINETVYIDALNKKRLVDFTRRFPKYVRQYTLSLAKQ